MTSLPVPNAGDTITAGYAPGQSGKALFDPNTDQLLPGASSVGGLSDNQIHGILNNQLGRDATPYELSVYKTAPIQTLANLKQTYANFNTNSLAGYLQSIGQDSSPAALQTLGQKYGINAGTPDGNTQLLNVLKNGTQPTTPTVGGTVAGATTTPNTPPLYDSQTGYLTTYGVTSGAPVVKLGDPGDGSGDKTGINYSGVDATGNGMGATPQDAVNTPGISGSISGATGTTNTSTPPTPDGTVDNDPDVWNATQTYNQYLNAYQTAQKAVASIDAQINTLRESQQAARGEFLASAAKSGGVVTSAQENAELAVQNRDINEQINSLLDQRAPYATEQSEASTALNQAREELNSARSDFYKSSNLDISQEKLQNTETTQAEKTNNSLITKYPDAGILPTDDTATMLAKLEKSPLYLATLGAKVKSGEILPKYYITTDSTGSQSIIAVDPSTNKILGTTPTGGVAPATIPSTTTSTVPFSLTNPTSWFGATTTKTTTKGGTSSSGDPLNLNQ